MIRPGRAVGLFTSLCLGGRKGERERRGRKRERGRESGREGESDGGG